MRIKVIELSKIDELLEDYKKMKNKGELFSEFIEVSKCLVNDDDDGAIFDFNLVDEDNLIVMQENKFGDAEEVKDEYKM
jgi:hypothetical protein